MRTADTEVTGQLIGDADRREKWLELVRALQVESEVEGGRLSGWTFHGTDEFAAREIRHDGLRRSFAIVESKSGEWIETTGTHFGTANVAAFYAEDRIENLEDDSIELSIFAVRISDLEKLGEFAIDGQMIDCPLYSRYALEEVDAIGSWESSQKTWVDFYKTFETIVVLSDVPSHLLIELRSVEDLINFLESEKQIKPHMKRFPLD